MEPKNKISPYYPYIKSIFINWCIEKVNSFLFYFTSKHLYVLQRINIIRNQKIRKISFVCLWLICFNVPYLKQVNCRVWLLIHKTDLKILCLYLQAQIEDISGDEYIVFGMVLFLWEHVPAWSVVLFFRAQRLNQNLVWYRNIPSCLFSLFLKIMEHLYWFSIFGKV